MKKDPMNHRHRLIKAYFLNESQTSCITRSFRIASLNEVTYISSVLCKVNKWTMIHIDIVEP